MMEKWRTVVTLFSGKKISTLSTSKEDAIKLEFEEDYPEEVADSYIEKLTDGKWIKLKYGVDYEYLCL